MAQALHEMAASARPLKSAAGRCTDANRDEDGQVTLRLARTVAALVGAVDEAVSYLRSDSTVDTSTDGGAGFSTTTPLVQGPSKP